MEIKFRGFKPKLEPGSCEAQERLMQLIERWKHLEKSEEETKNKRRELIEKRAQQLGAIKDPNMRKNSHIN